jgi:hypothetical protein
MTSLAEYGIGIRTDSPDEPPAHYEWVKQDCDWQEAVALAIQCRKTHPNEAIELWPISGSHCVHVVREVVD